MLDMKVVKPEELAWSEADGAASINAEAVAAYLNDLLSRVERLERTAEMGCACMNCIVIGGKDDRPPPSGRGPARPDRESRGADAQ